MVTGLPVAFARAEADSVALRLRWAPGVLPDESACGDRVGPAGAAWATTAEVSDPAARAATTVTATGLDVERLNAHMAGRKADIEVGVLRGTQAAPPWVRAAVHSECKERREPSTIDRRAHVSGLFLTYFHSRSCYPDAYLRMFCRAGAGRAMSGSRGVLCSTVPIWG